MLSGASHLEPARRSFGQDWGVVINVSLKGRLRNLSSYIVARQCVLCESAVRGGLLCDDCMTKLPRIDDVRCPVCAYPMPLERGANCPVCTQKARRYDRTIAAFRYESPMERLMLMLKFQNRPAVAEFLARQVLASGNVTGDVVIPIPLYKARLKERGYNHAAELARFVASGLRLPLLLEGYGRVRDTASQAMLSGKDRRENVRNAFACKLDLSGKSVIVVDDLMASGATLNEMARVLKRCGAATVTNLVVACAKRV